MARELERLTAAQVRRAKPGWHADGGGLYLQARPDGSYWYFRYKDHGREKYHSLGPAHTVTLADARARAQACRLLRIDGRDPQIERATIRAAAQVEAAKKVTVTEAIDRYFANHRGKWRSEKHAKEWRSTLATHAEPVLGRLPVGAIDTTLVLKVVEPIWQTKTVTASRVRQRLESVLDFAKVRGWRDGDNPARWKGHLDHILPKPRELAPVENYAAMPYADMPDFMRRLRAIEGVAPRCLEFLILTAARNKEARRARWSQIEGDVWKCPPEEMKRGKEHHVPLSVAARAVIERMRGQDAEFVFPGRGGPIGDTALGGVLKELGVDCTVHGFRSSFRDWVGEETEFARELAEMALSHRTGDDTEEAYRRGEMLKRRRKVMEAWARFVGGESGKVIDLKKKRA
jgi:integrase